MIVASESMALGPDEFALHFETQNGVEADALAVFLKRAATIARRNGGELRVVAFHDGSLNVILKAIKKSKIAKNAQNEFLEKPIDTTIKVTPFVLGIVWALAKAMSPDSVEPTPLAKAGAQVIIHHSVEKISIVTGDSNIIVMDAKRAKDIMDKFNSVRANEEYYKFTDLEPSKLRDFNGITYPSHAEGMNGEILMIGSDPYFQPDGYNFLVPIDMERSDYAAKLKITSGKHRVSGKILPLNGQPDRLVVNSITGLLGSTATLRLK